MFHSAQAVSKDDRKLFMIQKVHAETFIDFRRRETLISKWGQEFPWFQDLTWNDQKWKNMVRGSTKSQLNQYKPFLDRQAYMFLIAMHESSWNEF